MSVRFLIYSLGSTVLTTSFPHVLHVPAKIKKSDFILPFFRFMLTEHEQVLHHVESRIRGWIPLVISSQRFLACGVNFDFGNGIDESFIIIFSNRTAAVEELIEKCVCFKLRCWAALCARDSATQLRPLGWRGAPVQGT